MTSLNVNFPSLSSEPVRRVFDGLKKDDLDRFPRLIVVRDGHGCGLAINFYKDYILTSFKNEKKTVKLSSVLAIISSIYGSTPKSLESSASLKFIEASKHLFNPEFARLICPKLGLKEHKEEDLLKGIRTLYIGRCIYSLGESMAQNDIQSVQEKEFFRIACVVKKLNPVIYSQPIL